MVGALTVFGNCALKTPTTYTVSESLIVIEYNRRSDINLINLKKYPETLPRLNWFASARELS